MLNLEGYDQRVRGAVKCFWESRERDGVRSGKTLDGFVDLLAWVVHNNGLPNARVVCGREASVPGFFRPTKLWDVLILNEQTLIAAIEMKSIADSFGKNSNNRAEEALGSGIDLREAFRENAIDGLTQLFTGYLILVENCQETQSNVQIQMKYFRAMPDFVAAQAIENFRYERNADGVFQPVDGVSYMQRFCIMCRRLMQKELYRSACVISSPRTAITDGSYADVSHDTSIRAFLASLGGYVSAIAASS